MSCQWAMEQENAISSPSLKIEGKDQVIEMAAHGVTIISEQNIARLDVFPYPELDFCLDQSDSPRMNIGNPKPMEIVLPSASKDRR